MRNHGYVRGFLLYMAISKIEYWLTTSKEWNACLFLDIEKKNWKKYRLLWKSAVETAERIYIPKKMKEIWELKRVTDELFISKQK